MRIVKKIVMKFVTLLVMVALLGAVMRYVRPLLMKSAGLPTEMPTAPGKDGVHFSSEESDLMATVFKSAIRLLTGSATRKELAGELSTKLYAGRADAATMSELGIELVQPGGTTPTPGAPQGPATNTPARAEAGRPVNPPSRANPSTPPATPPGGPATNGRRDVLLARLQGQAMANPELALAPVVLTGMLLVHGIKRRRRSPLDDLVLPDMSKLLPSDSEPYEMTHAVHALKAEDFELLVALVYQRQGYRVSMPAGLSGGRGGDFTLQRKSERLLVQCKNMRQDHRLPIERVRELHESVQTAGATRGLFVASCGFTWDARNYAKAKGITVINARTLDALITEARESEDEDLLAVAQWAPKFMSKVKLTPPTCPTCEAEMEHISVGGGSAWVCSQRPDCRGRRNGRKYQTMVPTAAPPKPARASAPLNLAKLTKSITFTKLTRSINFTKLTKLAKAATASVGVAPPKPPVAPPPKPVAPEVPSAYSRPAKLAAFAKPATPAAKAAVCAAAAAASAKPAKSAKAAAAAVPVPAPLPAPAASEPEPPSILPPARLFTVFPTPKETVPPPAASKTR